MTDELHPVGDQLCFALYAASRAMTAAYHAPLADLELTYPQFLAMLALWTHGTRTISELGAELALDSGTLTPLVKRLEARGLVARTRRTDDERVVEVALTAAGKRLRQRACAVPAAIARAAGITRAEATRLHGELRRLTAHLDAAVAAAPAPSASPSRRRSRRASAA